MRTIRASELGAFQYCRRAWWYRVQGVEPENQAEMALGSDFHRQHGRQVLAGRVLALAGGLLLLAALALLAVGLTLLWV
ncbi:MAG: hypothetical protein HPY76_10080 [Anaerolineae bacterium]|nr:hypothetical protein [Anaerolineae bacterium]